MKCVNCGTPDSDCLNTARDTGSCCCPQCREWPMHERVLALVEGGA